MMRPTHHAALAILARLIAARAAPTAARRFLAVTSSMAANAAIL